MTTAQSCAAMFRFHLNRPWRFWILVVFLAVQAGFTNLLFTAFGTFELSGIETEFSYLTVLFSLVITMAFIGSTITTASSSWAWILPNAEFLFSLPIQRRHIYATLLIVAFTVLLFCPVVGLIFTMVHQPDLRLSLYHSATQNTEAWRNLALYQRAFPSSSIIQLPHTGHPTLLVPHGEIELAMWTLWQTVLAGMVLQALSLVQLSSRSQRRFYVVVACLPAATILLWTWIGAWIDLERLFFFYTQHWRLIWSLTLVCFVVVQRLSWQRIDQLEVS